MENQEHVDLLRQGVRQWNEWRERTQQLHPDLGGADLSRADLRRADFSDTKFDFTSLREANLSEANLSETDLYNADLSGANLSRANLRRAYLGGADLSNADLTKANLSEADLSGAGFTGANLSGAEVGGTLFANVDLRKIKGLDTVQAFRPSSIGIDTIYRSRGQIPETFLRRVGIPETFLTNMRALVELMSPIDFYSCFISYSSKDETLARRLHADLQASGVRWWFAPEDLKIGTRLRQRIDEAIHLQDKLLLLLSKRSIASTWVETEVEAALEKEDRQQREVLFPVRLDDAVMQTTQAWAAKLRRDTNIGDFTNWTDPQAYHMPLTGSCAI